MSGRWVAPSFQKQLPSFGNSYREPVLVLQSYDPFDMGSLSGVVVIKVFQVNPAFILMYLPQGVEASLFPCLRLHTASTEE